MATLSEPVVRERLNREASVRVLVIRASRSTTKCRFSEQFPKTIIDREASALIKSFETPWTICDLEDVVTQRVDRRIFAELEPCNLRSSKGIYGQKGDDLHFRKDVAVAAGDELIKACHRTALSWYGEDLDHNVILIILAAGWNANGTTYSRLDPEGKAWRKAEVIALAELCALNRHPFSAIQAKMTELLARADTDHSHFLTKRIESIVAVPAPAPQIRASGVEQQRRGGHPGHLQGWSRRWNSSTALAVMDTAGATKRKREADILAEKTGLPTDTAEDILDTAGSLELALELEIFPQEIKKRWNKRLQTSSTCTVIDLDEEQNQQAPELSRLEEDSLQLIQMGFSAQQAELALRKVAGDIASAVELLLQG